jgi:uncharacterized membrane protein YdjX (TVP38/TMEM64 family)
MEHHDNIGSVERLAARRPRLRNLDALIGRDGWKLVCLLRISPVMPFSATSFALGLSSIGLCDYIVGTLASFPALSGYVSSAHWRIPVFPIGLAVRRQFIG